MRKAAGILTIAILFALGPAAAEEAAPPRFEVIVLGTYHAPTMFLSPDYTPAHIRATLELAHPDVVGVESHPAWFAKGRYHVVTYEAEGVAVPWAREKGLPVHGVDWKDIEAWDRDVERRALVTARSLKPALDAEGPMPAWRFGWYPGGVPAGLKERAGKVGRVDWRVMNSEEYGKARYRGQSPDDPDFAQLRDRGIAANIVEVMKAHPGKRMAVVIGAHHKPYLEILLGRRADVRVLRVGKDVPFPSAEQVEAAWTTNDLVVSLGHLLDAGSGYFHAGLADLPRARELLAKLEQRKGPREVMRYFRARLHVLEGRPDEALKELDGILASRSSATLYPFPMREWRMRYGLLEAARVEKARILMERDRRPESEKLLVPVARAFDGRLRRLEKDEPAVKRTGPGVKDAGFERGSRASDYYAGWYAYLPVGTGRLLFVGDESVRLEGERSLRLDVVEPARSYGFHLRQEIRLPPSPDLTDPLRLGLALRGKDIEWARLEIVPAFSRGGGAPLASRTVELTEDRWTRAEVEFPVPPHLEFGLVVRFAGPAGARLWLDAASELPLRYETVPEEWSRLIRARDFLDRVLAGAEPVAAVAPREAEGLVDPGFESRELVANPNLGWSCHAATTGSVRASFATDRKKEGKRSLRLEIVRPAPQGSHFLSRIVPPPPGSGKDREAVYSVALRTDRPSTGSIVAGCWPDGRVFRTLAMKSWSLGPGDWSRQEIRFVVPTGTSSVGLYVYLPNAEGTTVWIDDVRLE